VTTERDPFLPEDLLSAYVDAECTAAERAAIETRLATDADWARILDEVVTARDAVRGLPLREPPAGFIDSLISRAARSNRRHRVIAGCAAAAAIVMGFALASPTTHHSRVRPPIASLSDSHAATQSLQSDPVSGLAPIVATEQQP
jgi:anti-sigma factor RsiW